MSKEPIEYLKHIHDECTYISSVITENTTKDDFLNDETLKRAIVRSLEIIGEATKKIPIDFKMKWESINWKNMAGMREKMSQLRCSCGIHAFTCYKDIAALPLRW